MKLAEVHVQLSPEEEVCDLCLQEEIARSTPARPFIEANTTINPFKEYHWVTTTEGMSYNLCDDHYYEIATLQ